jgi:cytochrome c oxidase cbb3-type subunit 4
MGIAELQAYAYLIGTVIAVVVLYGYIVYLYKSEKSGEKDYEKYGKLALDDNIDSKPLVENESRTKHEKKEK